MKHFIQYRYITDLILVYDKSLKATDMINHLRQRILFWVLYTMLYSCNRFYPPPPPSGGELKYIKQVIR